MYKLTQLCTKSGFIEGVAGRGFFYFSCYGNSILYNERVEIGGYTIQFYHKLEQLFRSYCHKNIGIFVYNPMGGVQLLYTKWVTHSFSMGVANIQILITSHYQLQIIQYFGGKLSQLGTFSI